MKNLSLLFRFIIFLFSLQGIRNIKSLQLRELVREMLDRKKIFYRFSDIEVMRQQLISSPLKVTQEDLGAGSHIIKNKNKKIAEIARSSLSSPWQCQAMFRLAHWSKAKTILELGTSLGLSACYFASQNSQSRVLTLEGDEGIAAIAKAYFKKMQVNNITVIQGNFDKTLDEVLEKTKQIDLAFIDGNHRKEPTLRYFKQILDRSNANSILIFDDIYWSKGMFEAWKEIKNHHDVTASVDFFLFGMVFLSEEYEGHYKFMPRLF